MKTLSNSKINRWRQLIEYDIEQLNIQLSKIRPVKKDITVGATLDDYKKDFDNKSTNYSLSPNTEAGIEKQIQENKEVLQMLEEEISKMTFEFGFKLPTSSSNKSFTPTESLLGDEGK